jgi:glycosyltransferase involved in cell wall biosynthesis
MRIMVIHPGHGFSTVDVYTGVVAGLEANGAEVLCYPLDGALAVNLTAHSLIKKHVPQLTDSFDPFAVAGHAIIGRAIWREVDAVLVVTGQNMHFGAIGTLRKAGIMTALLCTESPYLTLQRERHDAMFYDAVFTNDKYAVPLFGRPNVHYLPAAYNPATHHGEGARAVGAPDVFFVGTAFPERQALFGGVDWTGIDLKIAGTMWDGTDDDDTIMSRLLDNETAATYYRAARINLNHHRTTADFNSKEHIATGAAYSLGPRAYEIAACGGFQLMDDSRPEAREVFGDSLAPYKSGDSADLTRQLRYWLEHPQERARMAEAQQQAARPHSWHARAARVLDILDGTRAGVSSQHRINTKEHPAWQPSTA